MLVQGTQSFLQRFGIRISEAGTIAGLALVILFLTSLLVFGIRFITEEDISTRVEVEHIQQLADFCGYRQCLKVNTGGYNHVLVPNAQSLIDGRAAACGGDYDVCMRIFRYDGTTYSLQHSSARCSGALAAVNTGTYAGALIEQMYTGGVDFFLVVQIYYSDGLLNEDLVKVFTTEDCGILEPPPSFSS